MPFSSPMEDEILSPTSPNIPHTSSRKRRKNAEDGITKGNHHSRSGRISSQSFSKRQSQRRQEKDHKKPRWPGLNVVTNFTKSSLALPPGMDAYSKNPRKTALNAQPGYVTISGIRTPINNKGDRGFQAHKLNQSSVGTTRSDLELRNHDEIAENRSNNSAKGSEGLGLQALDNPPAYDAYSFKDIKSRVNSLKQSPIKLTELSPSDGPIIIGISVPSAKLAEHSISPDVGPTPITTTRYITDQDFPDTPTIVVTPAKLEGSWNFTLDNSAPTARGRRRPASSIYSPAMQHDRHMTEHGRMPPVPVARGGHSGLKHTIPANPAESTTAPVTGERPESSCTVFDEDDNPVVLINQERPRSGESQIRILNRSSLDTIGTRPRSQGWWNYIVSPFIPRSNTTSFGGWAPKAASPVPSLPSPYQGEINHRRQQISSLSPPSPLSILDSDAEKDRLSIWADLRQLESERLKIGFSFNRTSGTSSTLERPRALEKSDISNAPELFEGFGAAAEYFNACWHDQNSPSPYFDCQNHSCIPLGDGCFFAEEPDGRSQVINIPHHESKKESDIQAAGYGFQQEPANRFSAAFSQTNNSRPRALSEATVIEDVDATPEVHEARIAPVLRAGPPIAATLIAAPKSVPFAEPEEASHTVARSVDPANTLAAASDSAPAQPVVASPASRKALLDPALAATSINISTVLQVSSPEPGPTMSPEMTKTVPSRLPAYSPSRSEKPPKRFVAVNPPDQTYRNPEPPRIAEPNFSTSGANDGLQQTASGRGMSGEDSIAPAHNTYIVNHYHDHSGVSKQHKVALADLEPPAMDRQSTPNWERQEKSVRRSVERKPRSSTKSRGCFRRDKRPMTKKKKRLLWGIAASLVLIIILIVVLAMTLTRKKDDLEVQSQWLNITGFPPIPTGISTIVQLEAAREDSGCIQPTTVWSCALPKEDQKSIAPNKPNQPNFRVEIRFRNGTSTNSTFAGAASREKRSLKHGGNPVSASNFVRRKYLRIRDALSDSFFSPSPAAPSQEEQAFLGKTTDKNSAPFDGQTTPFFMSFLPASKLPSRRLMKRQKSQAKNSTDPFPDIANAIPPPDTNSDGTAASANLLPFPAAQPLRLYDRGLATEHYGFYTYFDRSIFLKSTALLNDTGPAVGEIPADQVGGADKSAATVRCTWRQTRFLVQIWTNAGAAAPLLKSANATASKGAEKKTPPDLTSSSANDFVRPGSFPYPVSITLDRHGGALDKKFIFCYGLDSRGRVLLERKKIQLENRAFGGTLVNPARGPFKGIKVGKKEGGPGGIDGGDGGCGCQWRNWGGPFGGAA